MMSKVELDLEAMKSLLEVARRNGTVGQWADIALEWMEAANKELIHLRSEQLPMREGGL
jgi:hypothetical protein